MHSTVPFGAFPEDLTAAFHDAPLASNPNEKHFKDSKYLDLGHGDKMREVRSGRHLAVADQAEIDLIVGRGRLVITQNRSGDYHGSR